MYYATDNQEPTSPVPATSTPAPFNWNDFASSSENSSQSQGYTGPTPWSEDFTKQWLGKLEPWLSSYANDQLNSFGSSRQGMDQYANNQKAWIEQGRNLMPQQYAQQMALSNARQVQQPLNTMSSRGVLNSSVTGDALSKILREQSARQGDQYTQANLWAANQNQALNQSQEAQRQGLDKEQRAGLLTSEMNYSQMLPALLNSLRYSQNTSSGSGSSYGGLLDLLLASQGG